MHYSQNTLFSCSILGNKHNSCNFWDINLVLVSKCPQFNCYLRNNNDSNLYFWDNLWLSTSQIYFWFYFSLVGTYTALLSKNTVKKHALTWSVAALVDSGLIPDSVKHCWLPTPPPFTPPPHHNRPTWRLPLEIDLKLIFFHVVMSFKKCQLIEIWFFPLH